MPKLIELANNVLTSLLITVKKRGLFIKTHWLLLYCSTKTRFLLLLISTQSFTFIHITD